jgi:hypothetical protein
MFSFSRSGVYFTMYKLMLWIRNGSGFNRAPGPKSGSGFAIRIRIRNPDPDTGGQPFFEVLDVLF